MSVDSSECDHTKKGIELTYSRLAFQGPLHMDMMEEIRRDIRLEFHEEHPTLYQIFSTEVNKKFYINKSFKLVNIVY